MSVIARLMEGCVYRQQRWSGDCGEMSLVDEDKTDELIFDATNRLFKLQAALERIRDCGWPGPTPNRADFMQEIAREALE